MNNELKIPDSLKDFVYIDNGEVCAIQKLPVELEEEFEQLQRKLKKLTCPNCGELLMFLMPSGTLLSCNKCNKYFKNDDNKVGEEMPSPYTENDILY